MEAELNLCKLCQMSSLISGWLSQSARLRAPSTTIACISQTNGPGKVHTVSSVGVVHGRRTIAFELEHWAREIGSDRADLATNLR